MVNIPGILGYAVPGAYSIVRSRMGSVALPGGATITVIMGQGQREEILVERAVGGGLDGLPAQYDPRLVPDGRYYQTERYPVARGSVQVYLNPLGDGTDTPLVEITTTDDGSAWADEFDIETAEQVDQINGDAAGPPPTELDTLDTFGEVAGNSCVVQGFRPDVSGELTKMQLWLEMVGSPVDDITVKIFGEDTANPANPTISGTELATATIANASIPASGSADFVDVTFSTPAELTEGELYFFRLERSSGTPDGVNHFAVGINTSDSYGGLNEDFREGDVSLWPVLTTIATNDMIFRTFMTYGSFGTSYDLYGVGPAGAIDEDDFGLDGYQGASDGSGFYDTAVGRRYGITPIEGTAEPQHYYIDYTTGQVILDHALNASDRLIIIYVAELDLNEYEVFFDLEDVYAKHGFPSVDNTISQAATMAVLNGAPVIAAIHAGTSHNTTLDTFYTDIYWQEAFEALEKEDVNFVVPVAHRDVLGEVLISRYDTVTHGDLTGGPSAPGTELQEDVGGGDNPGINIYPLKVDEVGAPLRFELYKNGIELVDSVDYVLTHIGPGSSEPTKITLTLPLVDGDHVTVNYRPDIDLIAAVQLVGKAHVEFMSQVRQRKERILLIGAYQGYGFEEVLDADTGVRNVFGDSFRVAFFYPERIRTVINGETIYLDGQYLAACASGFMSGFEYIPEPLTRKTLVGFDIETRQKLTTEERTEIGSNGIVYIEPLTSGGRVQHAMTTVSSANPVEEEISVVRIRDYVAQVARTVLEDRFIGTVITDKTVPDIEVTTHSILESLVVQKIITEYASVNVKVDAQEPRQVNVGFDVAPVFPLNWIKIEFSIGVL